MGGASLGSYDILSTSGTGESTFLARRRGLVDERLFAIRLVDVDTAVWAMSKVGCGWFPNLGPLVEVGRDGELYFVVADISDSPAVAPPRRRGSRALVASVVVLLLVGAAGGAWALSPTDGRVEPLAGVEPPVFEPAPIEIRPTTTPPAAEPIEIEQVVEQPERVAPKPKKRRASRPEPRMCPRTGRPLKTGAAAGSRSAAARAAARDRRRNVAAAPGAAAASAPAR